MGIRLAAEENILSGIQPNGVTISLNQSGGMGHCGMEICRVHSAAKKKSGDHECCIRHGPSLGHMYYSR